MDLHYLDEDIIVSVSNIPSTAQGTFTYYLYRLDTLGNISTIFIGNTFIKQGTTNKQFDITDLIKGDRYVCKDLFNSKLDVYIMNKYYITININNQSYSSNEIQVCLTYRYPKLDPKLDCDYIDYEQWPAPEKDVFHCLTGHYGQGQDDYYLLPRIPFVSSNKFGLPLLFEKWPDYNNHNIRIGSDGYVSTTGTSYTLTGTSVFSHMFASLSEIFGGIQRLHPTINYCDIWMADNTTDKKYKIANVDICPARYYVCWQDRSGGFQVQPFSKTDTYTEKYTKQEVVAYNYKRKLNNLQILSKFDLQTGYITEDIYPLYETIFQSPYIKIYDTQIDTVYDVIITDGSYTEKTYMNQNRQLFNIKFVFELAKKQNITY